MWRLNDGARLAMHRTDYSPTAATIAVPNFSRSVTPGAVLTVDGLLQIVRVRRWSFAITFVACVAAVVVYAFLATPRYTVEAKLMPRQGDGSASQLQSVAGRLGGLASLAGIGLGESSDEQEALAYLKSRALFERFLDREQLLPVLFSSMWDPARQGWRADLKRVPTREDAWRMFDRIRTVNQDSKSRLVTVGITWKDRQKAASWANEIVRLANEELRRRALDEADAILSSLHEQLAQSDAIELRQSIYQLMQVQINRKVLAKARPDYALAILDPAMVPDADKFSSPKRALLLAISLPLALFLASCAVLALHLAGAMFRRVKPAADSP